jgi:hypothetical protein
MLFLFTSFPGFLSPFPYTTNRLPIDLVLGSV